MEAVVSVRLGWRDGVHGSRVRAKDAYVVGSSGQHLGEQDHGAGLVLRPTGDGLQWVSVSRAKRCQYGAEIGTSFLQAWSKNTPSSYAQTGRGN